jgi:hypothetical protein
MQLAILSTTMGMLAILGFRLEVKFHFVFIRNQQYSSVYRISQLEQPARIGARKHHHVFFTLSAANKQL